MTRREKIIIITASIPIIVFSLTKIFETNPGVIDIQKQRVIDQLPYLHTLERLVSVAEKQAQLSGAFKIPVEQFFTPDGNYYTKDSLTISPLVPIPAIINDTSQRNEFFRLVNKIQYGRDTISPSVYKFFEQLTDYLNKYPIPNADSIMNQNNLWFKNESIRAEWYQITKNISTAIDNLYTFK